MTRRGFLRAALGTLAAITISPLLSQAPASAVPVVTTPIKNVPVKVNWELFDLYQAQAYKAMTHHYDDVIFAELLAAH